jgi:thiol-disulfide isomerase/thioredoxin
MQQRRQRNVYTAGGIAGLVIIMIVLLVVLSLGGGGTKPLGSDSYAISAALAAKVGAVPVKDLVVNAKAEASQTAPPQKIQGKNALLTSGGKPEILYIGAEYCPYCAAERWALVMALSKFGTFSGLRGTTSSATDSYPNTPTFSFVRSTYTSKYLSFVPVELETNIPLSSGSGYTALQAMTSQQTALISKWDVAPYTQQAGGIPFVYLAGRYILTGPQYVATKLPGMQFASAVPYMTSDKNADSKDAESAAGYLVGDFCALTHNQPANVCSQLPAKLIGYTTSSPNIAASSTTTTKPGSSTTTTRARATTTTKKSSS